jgi:lipopolysaccharide/colanic/teichoic acid biosynthesis glycosyltransferase
VLIVFVFPLMAIIAVVIKCDSPGPVFCRQERIKSRGRGHTVLKFRTTVDGRNSSRDRHLTRMGPLLRYSRIDDLPQLVNVLRGEMKMSELLIG